MNQHTSNPPNPPLLAIMLADPKVRDSEEAPRLSAQCSKILDLLRAGNATNKDLAAVSLKYTGRISDLRASGYEINVISRDRKSGVTVYELAGAA